MKRLTPAERAFLDYRHLEAQQAAQQGVKERPVSSSWPPNPRALLRMSEEEVDTLLTAELQRVAKTPPSPGLPELLDAAVLAGKLAAVQKVDADRVRGQLAFVARRSGVSKERAGRAISAGLSIGFSAMWDTVMAR